MYQRRFQRNRRPNYNRFRGSQFNGKKRIKTFDPSDVVNIPTENISEAAYTPKHSFSDFQINETLKKNIANKGYTSPTPIQDQAIDPILTGQDLIGIANTGTGKTAAFLIPLIDKVLKDRNQRVLIVTPTRELAVQIKGEFMEFSKNMNIYSALCIGGSNMRRQIDDLRRNSNFVIGTPGRIMDFIRNRYLNLTQFSSVVLDETDRMVDIGFLKDIKYIISLLPESRQSLFFSATVDGKVRDILRDFVRNPITISVKKRETAANVEQSTIKVDPTLRIDLLHDMLTKPEYEKVLVFGRTKHGVQRLSDELVKRGFRSEAIHGNKKQSQRQNALDRFKRNEIQILIATDVASRGLDIPNVSHVINFDLPESYESYIHRIGRTGRADKKGVALTFVSNSNF